MEKMSEITMQGKICLVTGSTSGMGKVTARELANRGATVALVSPIVRKVRPLKPKSGERQGMKTLIC